MCSSLPLKFISLSNKQTLQLYSEKIVSQHTKHKTRHPTYKQERSTAEYAARVPGLAALARALVRELDPQDDVTFVRVRGAKGHELMIAPSALLWCWLFFLVVLCDGGV